VILISLHPPPPRNSKNVYAKGSQLYITRTLSVCLVADNPKEANLVDLQLDSVYKDDKGKLHPCTGTEALQSP
jgi:hypothetical protein